MNRVDVLIDYSIALVQYFAFAIAKISQYVALFRSPYTNIVIINNTKFCIDINYSCLKHAKITNQIYTFV